MLQFPHGESFKRIQKIQTDEHYAGQSSLRWNVCGKVIQKIGFQS